MKTSLWRKIVAFIFMAPVFAVVLFQTHFIFDYLTHRRPQCDYSLPDGYQGWVTVEYGNPQCPELPFIEGRLYHEINSSGRFCTSTVVDDGYSYDRYYYKNNRELNLWVPPAFQKSSRSIQLSRNQIWHHETLIMSAKHILYWFYVGEEQSPNAVQNQQQKLSEEFREYIKGAITS